MSKISKVSLILNIVLALLVIAGGSWFMLKYRKERSDLGKKYAEATQELTAYKSNPQAAAQADAQKIISEVAKVYALPQGETPTVGTVPTDQAKIEELKKQQPFFANAKGGDITLIYSSAKIAVLYRPSSKQIINVSSVTIQDQQTTQPTTP